MLAGIVALSAGPGGIPGPEVGHDDDIYARRRTEQVMRLQPYVRFSFPGLYGFIEVVLVALDFPLNPAR